MLARVAPGSGIAPRPTRSHWTSLSHLSLWPSRSSRSRRPYNARSSGSRPSHWTSIAHRPRETSRALGTSVSLGSSFLTENFHPIKELIHLQGQFLISLFERFNSLCLGTVCQPHSHRDFLGSLQNLSTLLFLLFVEGSLLFGCSDNILASLLDFVVESFDLFQGCLLLLICVFGQDFIWNIHCRRKSDVAVGQSTGRWRHLAFHDVRWNPWSACLDSTRDGEGGKFLSGLRLLKELI